MFMVLTAKAEEVHAQQSTCLWSDCSKNQECDWQYNAGCHFLSYFSGYWQGRAFHYKPAKGTFAVLLAVNSGLSDDCPDCLDCSCEQCGGQIEGQSAKVWNERLASKATWPWEWPVVFD
jgi:hypothetical protein